MGGETERLIETEEGENVTRHFSVSLRIYLGLHVHTGLSGPSLSFLYLE